MILAAETPERETLAAAIRIAHEYQTKRDERLARGIISELFAALKKVRRR